MPRETCEDFASCRQHQRHSGVMQKCDGKAIVGDMWCSKCGRKWYEVYVFYATVDSKTGEVLHQDIDEFHKDVSHIIDDIIEEDQAIPYTDKG